MLRTINHYSLIAFGCLVIGVLGGFLTGHRVGFSEASDRTRLLPNGPVRCNPGPWGELIYTPFSIAAPDDILPIESIEQQGTRWFLAGYTADRFVSFLQGTSMTPEQQQQFLAPGVMQIRPDGIELTPSPDLVFALPEDARGKIYQSLAQSTENESQVNYLAKEDLKEQFANAGLSEETMMLFNKLCFERGDYLMFSGVAALLAHIPTFDEKVHFAKALTRQRTMVLNLHLTPGTDIDALEQYWDRGCWGTDVRTIFRSMAAIPGGTWMNILMILPDLPSSEIYDYPIAVDNPLVGPPVNRDCAWTALNFFQETPNNNFGKMDYVRQELDTNYVRLDGSPRYGDLVLIARPDGFLVHAAIYIADDIWFTKNGSNMVHPWMLSKSDDVLKQFEFQINPDQHLTVAYYRDKRIQ